MSDDFEKSTVDKIDSVLESIKTQAERRGLDVEGKSIEEIKKLLAEEWEHESKARKKPKKP